MLLIGVHRAIRGSKTLFGFRIADLGFGIPAADFRSPPHFPATGGEGETGTLFFGPRPVLRSQRAGMRKDVEGDLARPAHFHVLRAGTSRGPGLGKVGRRCPHRAGKPSDRSRGGLRTDPPYLWADWSR